ncbi:MAG: lipid biosynthesis B12-binding/radical SAM protein [Pseudomonadota bacterium]|nr:lipid biosynthesis B12-binding/radical SAM protein [Pseudomonadota bacterium]
MRVLLVSANREHIPDPIFPLGLSYIAAASQQAGHDVKVADLCFGRKPLADLQQRIKAFQPDVVGLSIRNVDNAAYPLTTDYLDRHREVIDAVQTTTEAPVVLGGSGFSILPEAYMKVLNGDWGIKGEGEQAFVSLLDALENRRDASGIPGVLSRQDPGCNNVDFILPVKRGPDWGEGLHPNRHLFDYPRYIRRGGTGNIQTKRGCVFKCNYCTYPLLEGNSFRARAAGDVVDEIESLLHDYGPHPLFFVDSILNFPHGHMETLCEEILRRSLQLRWSCYATPVKLDRQQAQLMARAGCEGIELGSDAADDGQLRRLKKSFNTDTVLAANRHCLEAGLRVCHTLIFGAPGETESSIRRTCTTLRAMQATAVVAMTGVRLYPGTPLAEQLIAAGKIEPADIGLLPSFYIEPGIADFLPDYLRRQAREAGNWVLPGLEPPLLPASQRALRALGISGPLWRLLRYPWMRHISRTKFHRPSTSWGPPNQRRTVL